MQDALTPRRALAELTHQGAFLRRHIGPDAAEQAAMLSELGYSTRAALIDAVVPAGIRSRAPLDLEPARSEADALAELRRIAAKNQVFRSFIGQGYYDTDLPAVILRNLLESPAWYTAYTPYQPEISQGRLEALVNFQTMICDLTGMAIANASMLDEATAAAEAMSLCRRSAKLSSQVFYVADSVLPQTEDVVRTRAAALGLEIQTGPAAAAAERDYFGVLLQYPAADGAVEDYRSLAQAVHAKGGLVVVAADLLALTLLAPPGEWGADVVLGSAQRFGVPLAFGGPHAAYFATRDEYKRNMPGRLVGATRDSQGNPAYRLALQTREQHIRREKATSNICTAQVLLAVIAGMYAVYHGPQGLARIALRVHRLCCALAAGLKQMGVAIANPSWFDTLTIVAPAATAHAKAEAARVNLRRIDERHVGVALDETSTREDVLLLWQILASAGAALPDFESIERGVDLAYPDALRRSSAFLAHPVFHRHHSETAMLRYLRQLADRDLALDRSMIPLGSCTMKLNATSEMIPISWPEFARIHPFAPPAQTAGYRELIAGVERMLCAITGYAAVSLQPNAGSQGEYAGLLVIRAWHRSRGEAGRRVCLIPASAHGTNPASAHMAGLEVVVVACDARGNVDLADLRAKAQQHSHELAAIMVTYPSTHGVFEAGISEICDIVHRHGGQVYIDGANLNAMVGLCAPGRFGGDLSHLNLHKTFGIPHGGGGPGVGPLAVAAHLASFLPGHRELPAGAQNIGAVAAAPYGSAGILPISWMYLRLLGREGLRAASEVAILNANYVARRLAPYYPVLYSGPGGWVAHECILDLRRLKDTSGISVDDVAKRLMDYGFHSPTMSFPVAGTLMVEPTESESKAELERFIRAMIAIREEIRAVEEGRLDREDNPLKHAPHTAAMVCANEWKHLYSRELAAYPVAELRAHKYWPPVGRADNAYGDRNLFCTCLPEADS